MRALIIISAFLFFSTSLIAQTEADSPIYGNDTIIWFGADFSLFRLSNPRKADKDEKTWEYIHAWNIEYENMISNVKLASLLKIKKVINDKEFTKNAYETFLDKNWIIDDRYKISGEEMQEHLQNYTSSHSGIGLVYMLENFKKEPPGPGAMSKVHGYFVWFDISSKEIIKIFETDGHPSTLNYVPSGYWLIGDNKKNMPKSKGMTGYWFQGMVDATVEFSIEYKKGLPEEEERQY